VSRTFFNFFLGQSEVTPAPEILEVQVSLVSNTLNAGNRHKKKPPPFGEGFLG